jgi:hypothetical protein
MTARIPTDTLFYVKQTLDAFPWVDIESGLKVCSVNVTPAMAKDILLLNEKNRKLSNNTVKLYAEDMKNSQWGKNTSPISISNTFRLLDGQHRLKAVVESGKSIPFVFYFGQKNSDFQFIDGGRKRTAGDILSMSGYKNTSALAATGLLLLQHDIGEVGAANAKFSRNAKTAAAQTWNVELQESIKWCELMRSEFNMKNSALVFAHFCITNGKLKTKGKEFINLFTNFLEGKIAVSDLPGKENNPVVLLKKKLKTYMSKHMTDSHPNRILSGANIMEAFMNYAHNRPFKRFVNEYWTSKEEIGAFRIK